MTSPRRRFALVFAIALLTLGWDCDHGGGQQPGVAATLQVALTYGANGCTQSVGGAPTAYPYLESGQQVTWTAASTGISITFGSGSPFASSSFSTSGTSVSSTGATGTSRTRYDYTVLSIGGNNCSSPLNLGFIMK